MPGAPVHRHRGAVTLLQVEATRVTGNGVQAGVLAGVAVILTNARGVVGRSVGQVVHDPMNGALPNANTPPSRAASQ